MKHAVKPPPSALKISFLFNRGTAFFFSLLTVLLLLNGGLGYRNLTQLYTDNARVLHSEEVLQTLHKIRASITEAETGQRGYLITGDPAYLEPYTNALPEITAYLKHLSVLTQDNPEQQKNIAVLNQLVQGRLDTLHDVLTKTNEGGAEAGILEMKSGRGKRAMDKVMLQIEGMESLEKKLLKERRLHASGAYSIALYSGLGSVLIALLVMSAFILLLRRYLKSNARAAQEIYLQREQFRITLASIGDAVITTDTQARVTYLNAVAETLTGWKSEEASGLPMESVFQIINQHTRQPVENPIAKVLRDGVTVGLGNHTVLISKKGTECPIDDSAAPIRDEEGAITGVVLIFRDVKDRRSAELILEESEKKYRQLIQSLPTAIYTCDTEGRITLYNGAAVTLWGKAPQIGKDSWCGSYKIYDPDGKEIPLEDCPMARTLKQKIAVRGAEIIVERPDGERRHILPHPEPLFDAAGNLTGAINMLVDITPQKKVELALQKELQQHQQTEKALGAANSRLRHLDELKTQFIAIASHELKTPLTAVKGYAGILLECAENLTPDQKTYVSFVKEGADRMSRLVNSLLDISKIELGQMSMRVDEHLNLGKLLENVLQTFKPLAKQKEITLTEEFAPDLKSLCGDEDRLREVFENLLSNALKYTPRGGTIWIRSKNLNEEIEVSVKDSGIGISEQDQTRIFEPFQRLRQSGLEGEESTGLGLALVKKIVEFHEGKIQLKSTPGKGSTFSVRLPVKQGGACTP